MYEKNSYEWNEWHKIKNYCAARDTYVRTLDCEIAEKIFYYTWLAHNPKRDFCGYSFSSVLTAPWHEVDAKYILEPDTRVPNYSSNINDALKIAFHLGWKSLQLGKDENETCKLICDRALALVSGVSP